MTDSLDLDIPLKVPLEGSEEEAIGTLVDLGNLDVFGFLDGLPMLRMLH